MSMEDTKKNISEQTDSTESDLKNESKWKNEPDLDHKHTNDDLDDEDEAYLQQLREKSTQCTGSCSGHHSGHNKVRWWYDDDDGSWLWWGVLLVFVLLFLFVLVFLFWRGSKSDAGSIHDKDEYDKHIRKAAAGYSRIFR